MKMLTQTKQMRKLLMMKTTKIILKICKTYLIKRYKKF